MEDYERIFDFQRCLHFEASEGLTRTRSSKYKHRKPIKNYETWNRPAPDMRMQLYHPHPVPRNSREAIQPWKYKASFDYDDNIATPSVLTPKSVMPSNMQRALFGGGQKEKTLVLSSKVLRPYEAKLLFVKKGMLPKQAYVNPAAHDFRAYPSLKSLGLPEFETAYEKDPYNLRFKTKTIDQVYGPQVPTRDSLPGKQLGDVVLRQPPKWQKDLHLPQPVYPTRDGQTTRHRPLYRSPHSAFMERVERKLTQIWENERCQVQTAPKLMRQSS